MVSALSSSFFQHEREMDVFLYRADENRYQIPDILPTKHDPRGPRYLISILSFIGEPSCSEELQFYPNSKKPIIHNGSQMRKLLGGREAISWHNASPTCQLIADRPPRDFRICKTLWTMSFASGITDRRAALLSIQADPVVCKDRPMG